MIEFVAVSHETYHDGPVIIGFFLYFAEIRKSFTLFRRLQSPYNTFYIVGMYSFCSFRVFFLEPVVKSSGTVVFCYVFQLLSVGLVLGRSSKIHFVNERIKVKSGTAGDHGGLSPLEYFFDGFFCHLLIDCSRKRLNRINCSDKMMFYDGKLVFGGFCTAYIHMFIKLHGVAGNYFTVCFPGDLYGIFGFPHCCGACHHNYLIFLFSFLFFFHNGFLSLSVKNGFLSLSVKNGFLSLSVKNDFLSLSVKKEVFIVYVRPNLFSISAFENFIKVGLPWGHENGFSHLERVFISSSISSSVR